MNRRVRDCHECNNSCTTETAFRCARCGNVFCNEHAWAENYAMCKPCGDLCPYCDEIFSQGCTICDKHFNELGVKS